MSYICFNKSSLIMESKLSLGDFRSDTTTRPSEKMREIIKNSAMMVDYESDDPGILKLQEKVAHLFGKE